MRLEAPPGWTGRKAKGHLSSSATWPTGPAVRDAHSQPSSTSFGSPGLPCHRRGNWDAEKGIESAGVTSTSADRRPGQPRELGGPRHAGSGGPVTRLFTAPACAQGLARHSHWAPTPRPALPAGARGARGTSYAVGGDGPKLSGTGAAVGQFSVTPQVLPGTRGAWSHWLKRRRENRSGQSCTGSICPGPAVTDATVPTTHRPALVGSPAQAKGAGGRSCLGSARRQEQETSGDHAEPTRCPLLQTQTPRLSLDPSWRSSPGRRLLPPPSPAAVAFQPSLCWAKLGLCLRGRAPKWVPTAAQLILHQKS